MVHPDRARTVRRLATAAVLIATLLLVAACTPPTTVPPGLALPDPGLPTAVTYQQFNNVSCVPTGECVAVGNASARWDGTRWTLTRPPWNARPVTAALTSPYIPVLPAVRSAAVSCVSATWCMAVTWSGTQPTGAFVGDGITWRPAPLDARLVPRHVSCPTTDFCLARGILQPAAGSGGRGVIDPDPVTMRWDGRRWTEIATPAGPGDVAGLDCTGPTWCLAVGQDNVPGTFFGFAERWDGATWTREDLSGAGLATDRLQDVSCTAPGRCVAVGSTPEHTALALTRTDAGWTATGVVGGAWTLHSIDCAATDECLATGLVLNGSGSRVGPLLVRLRGTTGEPLALPAGRGSSSIEAVACATAARCVAVGPGPAGNGGLNLLTVDRTAVAANTGIGDATRNGPPVSRLRDVSCVGGAPPAAPYCVAVGEAWTADSVAAPRVITAVGNGTTWQVSVLPQPSDPDLFGGRSTVLSSVSCLAPRLCLAAGYEVWTERTGFVARWDGTVWSRVDDPAVTGLPGGEPQVACGSDGCIVATPEFWTQEDPTVQPGGVAVGLPGGDGLTWRTVEGNPGALGGSFFACASTTRCVGGGGPQAVSWDGRTTTPVPAASLESIGFVADADCAPDGACVIAGQTGALHSDGSTWTRRAVPANTTPMDVSCTARDRCTALAINGVPSLALFGPPNFILARWDGWAWTRSIGPRPAFTATWDSGFDCIEAWCLQVGGTGPYSPMSDPVASAPAAHRLPR